MKRVEIDIDSIERGKVEAFKDDENTTMPQAYAELVRHALDELGY